MAGKSRDSKTVVLDLDRLGRAEPEGGDWAAEEVRPRPPKRLLSLRVDADVLEFFRSQGRLAEPHERGAAGLHGAPRPPLTGVYRRRSGAYQRVFRNSSRRYFMRKELEAVVAAIRPVDFAGLEPAAGPIWTT
jgi:hypothetical protein